MFAGSEHGERAAASYTLIETVKLNGLDPEAYLRDVLTRIADHPPAMRRQLVPSWASSTSPQLAIGSRPDRP